jgi:Na+/serine symporter
LTKKEVASGLLVGVVAGIAAGAAAGIAAGAIAGVAMKCAYNKCGKLDLKSKMCKVA